MLLLGGAIFAQAVWIWEQTGFGLLPYDENLRRIIATVTLLMLGVQIVSASFFMSVLGLKTTSRKPPEPAV
jgi:hypothetical protein